MNQNVDKILSACARMRWIKDQFNTEDPYVTQTSMHEAWLQAEASDAISELHGICWDILSRDILDQDTDKNPTLKRKK